MSTRGVEKQIATLKSDGILQRVGPAKGGYWAENDKGLCREISFFRLFRYLPM